MFALAAIAKITDPLASAVFVRHHLQRWSIPLDFDLMIVGCVVATELSFCVALAVWGPRRRVVLPIGAVLVGYTIILGASVFDEKAPGCACFGVLAARANALNLNIAGLVRNAGLIGMCAYMTASDRSAGTDSQAAPQRTRTFRVSSRAFTLIELLITISVIGVLIMILMPTLASVRKHARVTRELVTAREVASATTMYTDAWQSVFPYMARAGHPLSPMMLGGRALPDSSAYFQQAAYYASLLHPEYYSDRASIESKQWSSQGNVSGEIPGLVGTLFFLTQTAFAAPSYFGAFDTPDDDSLYRPVRTSECAFPSAKILILDMKAGAYASPEGLYDRNKVVVAMTDGSGAFHECNIETDNVSFRPLFGLPFVGMTTHDGIAGRDF
jgi:prepilin-type N-terminal cleavage/methylation domain-containing protein